VSRAAPLRCILAILLALVAAGPLLAQAGPRSAVQAPCCTVGIQPLEGFNNPLGQAVAARLTAAFEAAAGPDGPVTWLPSDTTARPRDAEGRPVRPEFMFTAEVFVDASQVSGAVRVAWKVEDTAYSANRLVGHVDRVGAYADSSIVNQIRREIRARLPQAGRL
jgi:hypothetical protein